MTTFTLDADLALITGRAEIGSVVLTPTRVITDTVTGKILTGTAVPVPLNSAGKALIENLRPCDDPDLSSADWEYKVEAYTSGQRAGSRPALSYFIKPLVAGISSGVIKLSALTPGNMPSTGGPFLKGDKGDQGDPGPDTGEAIDPILATLGDNPEGDDADVAARLGRIDGETQARAVGVASTLTSVLERGVADTSLVILGDSTGNEATEWFYLLVEWLADQFPSYTVTHRLWDDTTQAYLTPTTVQTGTGSRTLTVYNGSHPGAGFDYPLELTGARFSAMVPVTPTTVICSFGYNSTSPTYRSQFLTLSRWIRNMHPTAELVWCSQPPKGTGNSDASNHLGRLADVRSLAFAEGYGLIDATRAFIDHGDYTTDLIQVDGIHPNTTGSALWAEEAKTYFSRHSMPRLPAASVDRIFVSPTQFLAVAGTPSLGVTGGINVPVWFMDATADEAVVCSVDIPPRWKSVNVYLLWSTAGGSTDSVAWRVDWQKITSSMNANVSGFTWSSYTSGTMTTVAANSSANLVRATPIYTTEAFAGGRPLGFRVYRWGNNAGDTLAADAQFAGLLIERAE